MILFLDGILGIADVRELQMLDHNTVREAIDSCEAVRRNLIAAIKDDREAQGRTAVNKTVENLWWWYHKKMIKFEDLHLEEPRVYGYEIE